MKRKITQKNIIIGAALLAFIAMIFIPSHGKVLDILISIYWVGVVAVLVMVPATRISLRDGDILSTLTFVIMIFGFYIYLTLIQATLSRGINFETEIINFLQKGIMRYDAPAVIIAEFAFVSLLYPVIQYFLIMRKTKRFIVICARFIQNSAYKIQFKIDNEYDCGAITETEKQEKNETLKNEVDSCSLIEGTIIYISGSGKAAIFLSFITVPAGFLINKTSGNLIDYYTLKPYFIAGTVNAICFYVPMLLLMLSIIFRHRRLCKILSIESKKVKN
jgi:flagellar biosynthesis component FlhA